MVSVEHDKSFEDRIEGWSRYEVQSLLLDYQDHIKYLHSKGCDGDTRYENRVIMLQDELSKRNPPVEVRMPLSTYDDGQFTLGDNVNRSTQDSQDSDDSQNSDDREDNQIEAREYAVEESIPIETIEAAIKQSYKDTAILINKFRLTHQPEKLARIESQADGMRRLWAKIEELSGIQLKGY